MVHIMRFLQPEDVARMACVNKELKEISEEGYLWREFFSRKYKHSSLTAQSMRDWKLCFLMEVNNIVGDLRCFHTRNHFQDDVLGIPIEFTVNPKTERKDYIYSSMDLISSEAYVQDKLRLTAWKEKFSVWLPLYITPEHFQRGLPHIRRAILNLSSDKSDKFHPDMVLDVLPKMMSTLTVLLCDKGIALSHRAADSFAAIHRLFLGMMEVYPQLINEVDRRIGHFLRTEQNRSKTNCPALGEILPLLSVSQKYSWFDLASAYLDESFDRNVIWIGKQHPHLANADVAKVPTTPDQKWMEEHDNKEERMTWPSKYHASCTTAPGAEWDRLFLSRQPTHVSRRLLMFHVSFLRLFCFGSLDDRANRYDQLFGRVAMPVKEQFVKRVKRIMEADSWPQFFDMIEIACPTPAALSGVLRRAVFNSLRKGYHRKGADLTRIHASGVSKILLKGESYSAPPNLKKVVFEDSWVTGNGGASFFDASVLVYTDKGVLEEAIDYSHTMSQFYDEKGNCAIQHSGDVIDHKKNQGTHTVHIALHALPERITRLYFVLSAWTLTLKQVVQPWVRFSDPATEMELCRYNMDPSRGEQTAVIMCCMQRGRNNQWTVTAIGDYCMGKASHYGPIYNKIAASLGVPVQQAGNFRSSGSWADY